ncbi:Large terminase phage packaging protein [Monaibacterium marinum]|uniref:Large terminase phage packaging protein n=2 Tax=Pontivivens marinum TaxID=1690039 RepID=A0A2C9CVS1_9RHOB|nr:Large terminase phage packaging protein [Monaibacterium marinum]
MQMLHQTDIAQGTCSTSTPHEMSFVREFLSSASEAEIEELLASLSENALHSLSYLFEVWAIEGHQIAPEGEWSNWLIMGGRGAGKTRAGAEYIRSLVEGPTPNAPGRCNRIALLGETYDQARDVMVLGDSGLIACSPPDRKPRWIASRRVLIWPNGAEAQVFSASDPEAMRGPQFDGAWCDELAKWKKGQHAWDMLQFALRLGDDPRCVVTTTPAPGALFEEVLGEAGTVVTQAATSANMANLAPGFLKAVTAKYGGTALGRQELDGELIKDMPGALWPRDLIEAARVSEAPELQRIIVAVDPPMTGHEGSDACGIVVAGLHREADSWKAVILADVSVQAASPLTWAKAAIAARDDWGADRVVAEVNQGGDLVENLLRQVDRNVSYRGVHASRSKQARAEPVAALYEQGRVLHAGSFPALEDEMAAMLRSGYSGRGSPDRLDALVWAVTDLMQDAEAVVHRPQVRGL